MVGHSTLRNVDEVSAAAVGCRQTALEGTPRLELWPARREARRWPTDENNKK